MKRIIPLLIVFLCCYLSVKAQNNGGRISGAFQAQTNFFIRDSLIGAANIPQYDRQLFSADAWLNLNYTNWGFDFSLRFDMFNNSNLLNPTASYSDQGIGFWSVRKQIDDLDLTVGYIYDQIGSGLIFRAYEERPLLIDNALYGIRAQYTFSPDWTIKGFTGRQKQQFDAYQSIIKGINLDGFLLAGEKQAISIAPGLGIVNRTLDDNSMDALVAVINTYNADEAFVPNYNTYAFTFYNTLSVGAFSWFLEAAYKTEDAMIDPFGVRNLDGQEVVGDRFINKAGSVLYTSINYASKGLAITTEAKRTEFFTFRTRPQVTFNRGMINFLPPMARVNTYRLTSRYNAATQELGEIAFLGDIIYNVNDQIKINANASNIENLDGVLLYRELMTAITLEPEKEDWTITAGIQRQQYNQEVFEFKPNAPLVETITPFADFLYPLSENQALRLELQYMHVGEDPAVEVGQDYGSWAFALAEFTLAPHWSFSLSDMYNVRPGKQSPTDENDNRLDLHYPRVDLSYTRNANRFALSYVKQVEGVVCTGGICRLEPAFSGWKFEITSSF
ncbi:MAG: hypothetical protein HRU40_06945 [Saprospiraceae bacterium]|nr:hypothetical protein [Saprospiraceae bacterium]